MTAPGSNLVAQETMSIPIARIGERFAPFCIVEPAHAPDRANGALRGMAMFAQPK